MREQVGDRVVAIREADETAVYLYGRGAYAGRQSVPYWNPDAEWMDGETFRQRAEETIAHEMSLPQEEFVWDGVARGVDQWGNPMGDPRSFAERVEAHLHGWGGNPRIDLDEGGSAFGYMCWWAQEERYERMRAGRNEVLVPLPDPMPHSMITMSLGTGDTPA